LAAFVTLFWRFVRDDLDWQKVEQELTAIRDNIVKARGMQNYGGPVLDRHSAVPDAAPSTNRDYRFLIATRKLPTSIQDVKQR
jgi:hypothetical protein